MRILVLSDIHANFTALAAALEMARDRWDHIACLGDVVGYGPDPNEVSTKIRELGARTIRGNHDKAATDLMLTDDFNPVAKAAVDWTRSQLSPDNLKWIAGIVKNQIQPRNHIRFILDPGQLPERIRHADNRRRPRQGIRGSIRRPHLP